MKKIVVQRWTNIFFNNICTKRIFIDTPWFYKWVLSEMLNGAALLEIVTTLALYYYIATMRTVTKNWEKYIEKDDENCWVKNTDNPKRFHNTYSHLDAIADDVCVIILSIPLLRMEFWSNILPRFTLHFYLFA